MLTIAHLVTKYPTFPATRRFINNLFVGNPSLHPPSKCETLRNISWHPTILQWGGF